MLLQPAAAAAMAAPAQTVTVQICSQHAPGGTLDLEIPAPPADQQECQKCPGCVLTPPFQPMASTRVEAVAFSTRIRAAAPETPAFTERNPLRLWPPSQGPPARHDV